MVSMIVTVGLAAFHSGAMDEVVPLYIINTPEDGGFSFLSNNIGNMNLFAGIIQLIGLNIFFKNCSFF